MSLVSTEWLDNNHSEVKIIDSSWHMPNTNRNAYEEYKKEGRAIIQWLPANENNVEVEIRMPDNQIVKGLGEKTISDLKVDDIIQFQRFGFCRLDNIIDGKYEFWFTHK